MAKHYILRVGDGNNFKNSSNLFIWGIKSRNKSFLQKLKEGDKLWFIQNKKKDDINSGRIIAVADFVSKNKRDIVGPLITLSQTDYELCWETKGKFYDIEIHYNNLYNLSECNIYTGQKYQTTICEYDNIKDKLLVNLIIEYEYIYKYSKITTKM